MLDGEYVWAGSESIIYPYIEKRDEYPSTLFAKAAEKLSGVEGFDRLKASFQKAFRGKWDKNLNIDGVLQKTQSQMAELRADMMLVDEYGARGWEIGRELYWEGGNMKVEIDAMNIEKGIIEETKSGVPNKMKTLKN